MPEDREITSFNRELTEFDVDKMSVEELEQRLELAVANVLSFLGDCGNFTGTCGNFAAGSCGTF